MCDTTSDVTRPPPSVFALSNVDEVACKFTKGGLFDYPSSRSYYLHLLRTSQVVTLLLIICRIRGKHQNISLSFLIVCLRDDYLCFGHFMRIGNAHGLAILGEGASRGYNRFLFIYRGLFATGEEFRVNPFEDGADEHERQHNTRKSKHLLVLLN